MSCSSPTHDTDLRFSRRSSGSGEGILALAAAALRLAADSMPPPTGQAAAASADSRGVDGKCVAVLAAAPSAEAPTPAPDAVVPERRAVVGSRRLPRRPAAEPAPKLPNLTLGAASEVVLVVAEALPPASVPDPVEPLGEAVAQGRFPTAGPKPDESSTPIRCSV